MRYKQCTALRTACLAWFILQHGVHTDGSCTQDSSLT